METTSKDNIFLNGALPLVFLKTAAPMILMMLVNGSFSLVDAYFLGVLVGADALAAVTSMFPAYMLIVALTTLVSNGFSSVMARQLGAGEDKNAVDTFSQAMTLSMMVCGALISLFLLGGHLFTTSVSNGSAALSQMSYSYISILVLLSPLGFILAINGDSLRCEGRIPFMVAISLVAVLLNGVFNYILIAKMNWGVAGSAYGTILAQLTAIVAACIYRRATINQRNMQVVRFSLSRKHWLDFLSLGAPSSLSYVGLALSSAAILYNLQAWSHANYEVTVGAYGITTRLMAFIFLPLLGLSMAFQTITGNNVGANEPERANTSIKIALTTSLVYCITLQLITLQFRDDFGSFFVNDASIIKEVARILPVSTAALFLLGPLMIISMFFQTIGDAKRASILGLAKTYCFSLPLIFILPFIFSEWGIWFAAPSAEGLALLLTLYILNKRRRQQGNPFGLFFRNEPSS